MYYYVVIFSEGARFLMGKFSTWEAANKSVDMMLDRFVGKLSQSSSVAIVFGAAADLQFPMYVWSAGARAFVFAADYESFLEIW